MVLMTLTAPTGCPPCKALRKKRVVLAGIYELREEEPCSWLTWTFHTTKNSLLAQKEANDALAQKFGVEAFPTVVVLNKRW